MRRTVLLSMSALAAAVIVFAMAGVGFAQDTASATLTGYQEVPAVSTTGHGTFEAVIQQNRQVIRYTLSYEDVEGSVFAAHIHLGQKDVAGGVIAFLCGGGDKPACPEHTGTVSGAIDPADIIGPSAQLITQGEFDEAVAAMEAGVTYANVHSDLVPSGEIRGQISVD
jgi:hypothetical protein